MLAGENQGVRRAEPHRRVEVALKTVRRERHAGPVVNVGQDRDIVGLPLRAGFDRAKACAVSTPKGVTIAPT